MYAVINGNTYTNIDLRVSAQEVVYTGGTLTGIESVSGTVSVYANNDFLLREDNVSDYSRTVLAEGMVKLTNLPEPEPPVPPTPEPDMWDEMAEAIKDGVNSVE